MVFQSDVMSEYLRTSVIVSLYIGKWERNECKNYRGIYEVGIICDVVPVDRFDRGLRD